MALHGRDDQEAAAAAILVDEPGANGPAYGITGTGESPVKKRMNTSANLMKVGSGNDTLPRLHDHHPKPPPPSCHRRRHLHLKSTVLPPVHSFTHPRFNERNAAFRGAGGAADGSRRGNGVANAWLGHMHSLTCQYTPALAVRILVP